jgi:hypothetical protein
MFLLKRLVIDNVNGWTDWWSKANLNFGLARCRKTGSVDESIFNGQKHQACSISSIALRIALSSETFHLALQPAGRPGAWWLPLTVLKGDTPHPP